MPISRWTPVCDIVFSAAEKTVFPACFCQSKNINGGICRWRYDPTCGRKASQIQLPSYSITDIYNLKDGVPEGTYWRNVNN